MSQKKVTLRARTCYYSGVCITKNVQSFRNSIQKAVEIIHTPVIECMISFLAIEADWNRRKRYLRGIFLRSRKGSNGFQELLGKDNEEVTMHKNVQNYPCFLEKSVYFCIYLHFYYKSLYFYTLFLYLCTIKTNI